MNNFLNNGYNNCIPDCSKRNCPYTRHDQSTSATMLTSFTPKTNSNINQTANDQSNKVIDVGKKLLVGNVEQVQHWYQTLSFLEPTKIIYQVFGVMDSVITGSNKCEKIFCLHSENKKSRIVCVFYEVDRKMPKILKGALVLCTGHIKGKNKLQIFSIRELHQNDKNSFDRVSLISQWAIKDMTLYNKM